MARGAIIAVPPPTLVEVSSSGRSGASGLVPRTIPQPPGWPNSVVPTPKDTAGLASSAGTQLTIAALDAVIPVVYGKTNIGGNIVMAQENSTYLYVGIALCWGEINSVSNILFDGRTPTALGMTLGVDYFVYLGTSTQTLNTMLNGVNSDWSFKYDGSETTADGQPVPQLAYVAARFKRKSETQSAINPLRFTCDVEGLKVRDHRLDATLVTRYYSENPALIAADFKTDQRFGEKFPDSRMDWDALDVTADVCDFVLSNGKKRYTFGYSFRTQAKAGENVKAILAHFLGYQVWNEGKWKIFADVAIPTFVGAKQIGDGTSGSPVNLRGDEAFTIHTDHVEDIPSVVEVVYSDSTNGYQEKSVFEPATGSIDYSNLKTIRLLGCRSYDQARRTCIQIYNRGRNDKKFTAPMNGEWIEILPGNPVLLTTKGGMSATQAVVTSAKWRGHQYLGGYISGFLYDPAAYSNTVHTQDSVIPTGLPNPNTLPPAPTSLAVTEKRVLDSTGRAVSFLLITFTTGDTSFYKRTRITLDRGDGNGEITIGYVGGGPATSQSWRGDVPLLSNTHTIRAYTVIAPFDLESAAAFITFVPTYDLGDPLPDPGTLTYSTTDGTGLLYCAKPSGLGSDLVGGIIAKNLLADPANPPRVASLSIENWPDDATRQWDLSGAIRGSVTAGRSLKLLIQSYSRKINADGSPSAFSPGLIMSFDIPPDLTPRTVKVPCVYGSVRSDGAVPFATVYAGNSLSAPTGVKLNISKSGVTYYLTRAFFSASAHLYLPVTDPSLVIISANLCFYVLSGGGFPDNLVDGDGSVVTADIHQGTQAATPPTTADWTHWNATQIGSLKLNRFHAGSVVKIPLTDLTVIGLAAATKLALMLVESGGTTNPPTLVNTASSDETVVATLKPYLEITYTSPLEGASAGSGGASVVPFNLTYTPGTTAYTITAGTYVKAYIGNVALIPSVDFSVSGTTLTLLTVGGLTPANRFPNADKLWGEVIS